MKEEVMQQLREIKQSFRLMMNGEISKSMREKGVEYKINWGVSLPQLKEKAKEIGKNYDLAIELWKENIRECKILATLIMPSDQILPEVVDIWMEQTTSQEMAEIASFNLYQYLPYASDKAFLWMASDKEIPQICAYQVLARLFMENMAPNERREDEYLDQVATALQSEYTSVRHAAYVSVQKFVSIGEIYEEHAKSALKKLDLQLF
jgi:hypothetical protein